MTFLSATEQKLDLRTIANIGIGKYVIHTNKTYWGFSAGVNYNHEIFSTDADERNSMEGFFGTELNMFDIGDLNLLTRAVAYPSFTESGRWRTDFTFDMKYDLPMDFYIKLDSTRYVLSLSFGFSALKARRSSNTEMMTQSHATGS